MKHTTLIQNKDFLSDIRTKAELTEYLADKVVRHSRSSNYRLKKFMVTSRTHSKGSVDIPDLLLTVMLLILHAVSVKALRHSCLVMMRSWMHYQCLEMTTICPRYMFAAGRLYLCAVSVKNPHKSKWASLVPLLKSCSLMKKTFHQLLVHCTCV